MNRDVKEFLELFLVRQLVDTRSTAGICPGLSLRDEVVESCEPAVDRWLYILELRDLVIKGLDQGCMVRVLVVEIVKHQVDWRTHLDVLLLIGKIVK